MYRSAYAKIREDPTAKPKPKKEITPKRSDYTECIIIVCVGLRPIKRNEYTLIERSGSILKQLAHSIQLIEFYHSCYAFGVWYLHLATFSWFLVFIIMCSLILFTSQLFFCHFCCKPYFLFNLSFVVLTGGTVPRCQYNSARIEWRRRRRPSCGGHKMKNSQILFRHSWCTLYIAIIP